MSATLQSHMKLGCAADARHKRGGKQTRAETEASMRVECRGEGGGGEGAGGAAAAHLRDAQQRKKHGQQAAAASPRHQYSDWLTLTWLEERERFDGSRERGGGGGRNEESGGDAEREAAVGG